MLYLVLLLIVCYYKWYKMIEEGMDKVTKKELKSKVHSESPDRIEHVVIIDPVSKPSKFLKKQTNEAIKQIKKWFK